MLRFPPPVLSGLVALAVVVLAGCTQTPAPGLGGAPAAPPPAAPVASVPGAPPAAAASDAYMLISGGGTPLNNNYSQYLQAQAIAEFFARECPPEATWVFFGAGNREGAAPLMADTRRQVKRDGLLLETWLPGTLRHNRPATRDQILRALRQEILPRVRGGGTLYLFIGDHGHVAGRGEQRESAITLWEMKRRRSGEWYTDSREQLRVSELRRVLAEGLGEGRVVFCMTQCHSGGFHELGLAREVAVPRAWLTGDASWAAPAGAPRPMRIAGYTATDMASPAAGCDPAPDPDQWAGYERFMPEQLLGLDLMTRRPLGAGTRTLAAAHEAATLVDQTIDKPRPTSEHYLEKWATVIEQRLASSPLLGARARGAVAAYGRAVETGGVTLADETGRERQAQFARFTRRLGEQLPAVAGVLTTGSRNQLEQAAREREPRSATAPRRRGPRVRPADQRKAWTDTLRPAWKAAVVRDAVPGLDPVARLFELELLQTEEAGTELLLPRGGDDTDLIDALYWASGYDAPGEIDARKRERLARWVALRRTAIVAWGEQTGDAAVRTAARLIGPGAAPAEESQALTRRTAVDRVLFYRRVLAAWQFLETMEARGPLAELHALIALERTPLR